MAYNSGYITSIFGRRLGLQALSSNQSGGTRTPAPEFMVGPDALRIGVTTSDTTSANLYPVGVSYLTTAVSSGVYTLDPPVPGVVKYLYFSSTATSASPIYVRASTDASITFNSSIGSTLSVLASSSNVPIMVSLIGLTTAKWGFLSNVSTVYIGQSTST